MKDSESTPGSARRFDTHEITNANNRPQLVVEFTLPPERRPGDINDDGSVNRQDAAFFVQHLGLQGGHGPDLGNFNGDDNTGLADLLILKANFDSPAPSLASVPEPSSAMLVTLGLLLFGGNSRRRRRTSM